MHFRAWLIGAALALGLWFAGFWNWLWNFLLAWLVQWGASKAWARWLVNLYRDSELRQDIIVTASLGGTWPLHVRPIDGIKRVCWKFDAYNQSRYYRKPVLVKSIRWGITNIIEDVVFDGRSKEHARLELSTPITDDQIARLGVTATIVHVVAILVVGGREVDKEFTFDGVIHAAS